MSGGHTHGGEAINGVSWRTLKQDSCLCIYQDFCLEELPVFLFLETITYVQKGIHVLEGKCVHVCVLWGGGICVCMDVCACICVCMCAFLHMLVCVCMFVGSVCMYMFVWGCACMCICLSDGLCVYVVGGCKHVFVCVTAGGYLFSMWVGVCMWGCEWVRGFCSHPKVPIIPICYKNGKTIDLL